MSERTKLDATVGRQTRTTKISRRELMRWAGVAGVGGLGVALPGCSDPPEQSIVDSTVQPTALRIGGTINGRVVGLLGGGAAPRASIELVGVGTATADGAGVFSFRVEQNGDFELVIRAGGFFTHRTAVRVTGNLSLVVSMIESNGGLTREFLNQFARGTGPVANFPPPTPGRTSRWETSPEIRLYKRLSGAPGTALTDERIDEILGVINTSYGSFTAGALGFAANIVQVDGPPPDPSLIPQGVLCFFQTSAAGRGAGQTRRIDNQYSIASAHCSTGVSSTPQVLTRVFGQALGPTVVDDSMPSVMNANGNADGFTEKDLDAAKVLYARPPGNADPDTNPPGHFSAGG